MIIAMKIESMGRSLDDENDCYIDVRVTEERGVAQDEAMVFVRGITISRHDWDRLDTARQAVKATRLVLEARG